MRLLLRRMVVVMMIMRVVIMLMVMMTMVASGTGTLGTQWRSRREIGRIGGQLEADLIVIGTRKALTIISTAILVLMMRVVVVMMVMTMG